MDNKLIGLLIATVVGVIMAGSLLVPIVTDQTDHTRTFVNEPDSSGYIMTDYSESVTFTYNSTDGYEISGESVTPYNSNFSAMISDGVSIKWTEGVPTIIIFGDGVWNGASVSEFDLTASDGTIVGTYATTSDPDTSADVSATFDTLYYQDADGEYITNYGSEGYYLAGDTEIFATGMNASLGSGTVRYYQVSGSIDDGFTLTYNSGATTVTDYTITKTAVNGVDDVYLVESIVFNVSDSVTVTLDNVVVPSVIVGAESNADFYSGSDAVLLVVPVLVILAIMMIMVPYITNKN